MLLPWLLYQINDSVHWVFAFNNLNKVVQQHEYPLPQQYKNQNRGQDFLPSYCKRPWNILPLLIMMTVNDCLSFLHLLILPTKIFCNAM